MNNKKNLQYFENKTMRGLFEDMQTWQEDNQKRLLSTEIMKDGDLFACIALTNPTEVMLVDYDGDALGTTIIADNRSNGAVYNRSVLEIAVA